MQRILEIYDIESLSNFFSYTGYVPNENKYYQFVIWNNQNDFKQLIIHLKRGIYLVGFNNENYDYPILHHLIRHYDEYKDLDGDKLAQLIYKKSQQVIETEYSAIYDSNKYIPNLDLYKIWHFDNKGRSCSLKHLEVAMRMPNVEDMPLKHWHFVTTNDEVNIILNYNKNDVDATYQFFLITCGKTNHVLYKDKNKLQLRKDILKKYNLNCFNFPDVKIGEELLLKLYCDATGLDKSYVKKLKTPRSIIPLKKCIFDYVNFETTPFKELHNWLLHQNIYSTSGAFSDIPINKVTSLIQYVDNSTIKEKLNKESQRKSKVLESLNLKLQDSYIAYGTGGLHHSISGKFLSDDEWAILDIDVGLI